MTKPLGRTSAFVNKVQLALVLVTLAPVPSWMTIWHSHRAEIKLLSIIAFCWVTGIDLLCRSRVVFAELDQEYRAAEERGIAWLSHPFGNRAKTSSDLLLLRILGVFVLLVAIAGTTFLIVGAATAE